MSEEFTFYQFGRNSRTVHLYHRSFTALALVMNGVSYQLFTCTIRARDEHTRFGRRYFFYHLTDLLQRCTFSYHLIALAHLLFEVFILYH